MNRNFWFPFGAWQAICYYCLDYPCHHTSKFLSNKGGGDEEIHYFGNSFSDDAGIHWRMLYRMG